MSPFLAPGDLVALDWSPEGAFATGEIILGRDPGAHSQRFVLHRILRLDGTRILSKGDAAFAGELLEPGQIWGKLTHVRLRGKPGHEKAFRAGALDRLLAYLSSLCVPPDRLRARIARKAVRALGAVRRRLL